MVYSDLCWKLFLGSSARVDLFGRLVSSVSACLFVKRVSVAPVCSYRVLDFLNSLELIFLVSSSMFLVFLIYLEL